MKAFVIIPTTNQTGGVVENTIYEPFGAVKSGGNAEDKLYEGKVVDNPNQYYFGSRYYDAQKQIFTQPDSLIPDVYDPQQLNLYAFERNNPYTYADPTGNEPILSTLFIFIDIFSIIHNPHSAINYVALAADVAFLALPIDGGGLAVKGLAAGTKAGEGLIDTARAVEAAKDVGSTLRGAANPEIRATIQQGKQEHNLFSLAESSSNPNAIINKQIPGTRLRPDAYDPIAGTVTELKPNSPSGIYKGTKQLGTYAKALANYYGKEFTRILRTYILGRIGYIE